MTGERGRSAAPLEKSRQRTFSSAIGKVAPKGTFSPRHSQSIEDAFNRSLRRFPLLRSSFLLIGWRSLREGIGLKIRASTIFKPIPSLAELVDSRKMKMNLKKVQYTTALLLLIIKIASAHLQNKEDRK